jgi:hypothetical protein
MHFNFFQKRYLKDLAMRKEVAKRELQCIRKIHATLNCRPGGPEARALRTLVNRQNRLKPELTLTFSNPNQGSITGFGNYHEADFGDRRSAFDVLNDTTPMVELDCSADTVEEFCQETSHRFNNDLDFSDFDFSDFDFSIGHETHILDHSPSDSWKTPSLTIGSSDPGLCQLPYSAPYSSPYSNIWQTSYSVMDMEQPIPASHMKEQYQHTADWTIDLHSTLAGTPARPLHVSENLDVVDLDFWF